MKQHILYIILLTTFPFTLAQAQEDKTPVTRICMTEWHNYRNSSEDEYRTRFAYYEELGVETIRLGSIGDRLANVLKDSPFKIKLILTGTFITHHYKHPERMKDHRGLVAKALGPWNPGWEEEAYARCEAMLKQYKKYKLLDQIEEIVVDLGTASEPIYPPNWAVKGTGNQGFWCYSDEAQADFRKTMEIKYERIEDANRAWKLKNDEKFTSFADVVIPMPETEWAKGNFWEDMLVWYRDSKRNFIRKRIEQTKELAAKYCGDDVPLVVYLPGHAYDEKAWNDAIETASGKGTIRIMTDNDWLMNLALEEGFILQYTGVGTGPNGGREIANIIRKLKSLKSDAYKMMWGENAGVEKFGRDPIRLAEVITENNIRGIDYTWSNWLFEEDGITPSETFEEFRQAVEIIKGHYRED